MPAPPPCETALKVGEGRMEVMNVVGKRREAGKEIAEAGRAATRALKVVRRSVDFIAKLSGVL
jgi:hypothetical protein